MSRGRFIAFEGGEGTGKSTQAALLAASLGAVLTREPGGTPLGERLRSILLDPDHADLDARAEALLMAAARAQHVAQVVEPALAAGQHVVTDRYIGSSLAYQGVGRGLGIDDIASVSRFATQDLWPDLTVLLVVPDAVAASRLGARADGPDRMELLGDDFHRAVNAAFGALADGLDGWITVDAVGTVDEVAARVASAVASALS